MRTCSSHLGIAQHIVPALGDPAAEGPVREGPRRGEEGGETGAGRADGVGQAAECNGIKASDTI